MDDIAPRPAARAFSRAAAGLASALILCGSLALSGPAGGGEPPAFPARDGLDLARAAAAAWAPDAYLAYLENDEDLDATGTSVRWGYLFHSPDLDRSRAYSVRDGKILVAENLDMKFEAPPLAPDWIDSRRAVEAAEAGPARKFREKFGGRLTTMLLMRGAFQEGDTDETTWTLVYTAPGVPALFVVVDAEGARVRRTWRG